MKCQEQFYNTYGREPESISFSPEIDTYILAGKVNNLI